MTDQHREVGMSITTSTIFIAMNARVHEPIPSTRCFSVREMWKRPEYIKHRFSFPGAISFREVTIRMLQENISQTNTAWERVMNKRLYDDAH